jgi:hypothetical protein
MKPDTFCHLVRLPAKIHKDLYCSCCWIFFSDTLHMPIYYADGMFEENRHHKFFPEQFACVYEVITKIFWNGATIYTAVVVV